MAGEADNAGGRKRGGEEGRSDGDDDARFVVLCQDLPHNVNVLNETAFNCLISCLCEMCFIFDGILFML